MFYFLANEGSSEDHIIFDAAPNVAVVSAIHEFYVLIKDDYTGVNIDTINLQSTLGKKYTTMSWNGNDDAYQKLFYSDRSTLIKFLEKRLDVKITFRESAELHYRFWVLHPTKDTELALGIAIHAGELAVVRAYTKTVNFSSTMEEIDSAMRNYRFVNGFRDISNVVKRVFRSAQ